MRWHNEKNSDFVNCWAEKFVCNLRESFFNLSSLNSSGEIIMKSHHLDWHTDKTEITLFTPNIFHHTKKTNNIIADRHNPFKEVSILGLPWFITGVTNAGNQQQISPECANHCCRLEFRRAARTSHCSTSVFSPKPVKSYLIRRKRWRIIVLNHRHKKHGLQTQGERYVGLRLGCLTCLHVGIFITR